MIQLRDYQLEATQAVYDAIIAGFKAPIIAMPTGTGKSLTLAHGIHRTCSEYPQTRHMVLAHVKELVEQDYKAIRKLWRAAPVGIYSAGLNERDTMQPIIVGGSASVRNCVEKFGYRDFLWIDEAHMLSPTAETTYQKIVTKLREVNPGLIVVGLTATPYRRGIGCLTNGGIFDTVAIDLTTAECWKRFIAEGFLCPIYPKRTSAQIDVSSVSIVNGDYADGQLQAASDKLELNESIAREIALAAREGERRATLVFCSGIDHAEHMAEQLQANGMRARAVHSRMASGERDSVIRAFKSGNLDAVTNNGVLTTGFDYPQIDLIGMARATVSVGLWVQMLGRGTRPAPGKRDCVVLDFAGNRPRLGPIDAPYVPNPKKGEKTGELPVKVCDNCGCYAHISARVCEACGELFPIQTKLKPEAGTAAIMSSEAPIIETFNVTRVVYVSHARKIDGAESIRIGYMCGPRIFNKWINFENTKSKHFAHEWWRQFVGGDMPTNKEEALKMLSKGVAVTPKRVRVWTNKQYPEITGYEM